MPLCEKDFWEHFWSSDGEAYTSEKYLNNPMEMERFRAIINIVPKDISSLLDVGCHSGIFLSLLKKQRRIHGVGLERSRAPVQIARNRFNLSIIEGDAAALPFPADAFDAVSALEVIEHLPYKHYEKAIREIERVAKKYVLISVPYKEIRTFARCPQCSSTFHADYHLRSFDEPKLAGLFNRFEMIDQQYLWRQDRPLFYNVIRKLYKTLRPSFPATTMCPACGYRKENIERVNLNKDKFKNNLRKILERAWQALPKRTQYRWIVCVYRNKRIAN
jgi:ubiquinone/menaquinone biosynthesis C-methylase UbiE